MRTKVCILALMMFCASSLYAQEIDAVPGAFTWARFYGQFSRYANHNDFSPYANWDARTGGKFDIFQKGKNGVFFNFDFQVIGAEMLHNKVNTTGASYGFGFADRYSISRELYVSVGFDHRSTHFGKDFDAVVLTQRLLNQFIPVVDTSDMNTVFGEVGFSLPSLPFKPFVAFHFQPASFEGMRFEGGLKYYERPLATDVQFTLWRGEESRFVIENQSEIGPGGFTYTEGRMELFARNQDEGRFQLFVGGVPGGGIYQSINYGWYRGGAQIGIRVPIVAN